MYLLPFHFLLEGISTAPLMLSTEQKLQYRARRLSSLRGSTLVSAKGVIDNEKCG